MELCLFRGHSKRVQCQFYYLALIPGDLFYWLTHVCIIDVYICVYVHTYLCVCICVHIHTYVPLKCYLFSQLSVKITAKNMFILSLWFFKNKLCCAYVCGGQKLMSCGFFFLSPLFWDSLSLNLQLEVSVKLAAQWAPRIYLSLPPQCLDYRWELRCLGFYVGVGNGTQISMLAHSKLFPDSPNSQFLKIFAILNL